jgi:hypothetical protein
MRAAVLVPLTLITLAACDPNGILGSGDDVAAPRNLTYSVDPSGDPSAPSGLTLRWDDDGDPDLAVWHVYSRGRSGDAFGLRGSTSSTSFHDAGIPHLEYYVTAESVDGVESGPSDVVVVDERLALQGPSGLSTTSLNAAIALLWPDNAYLSEPAGFSHYRIYSAGYDLDADLCEDDWGLEGTTVAPEFVAGALANGRPRCFGISAISVEGWESLWSPVVHDTPRPDARNQVLYATQIDDLRAGFRFWNDVNRDGLSQPGELGLVGPGTDPGADFYLDLVSDRLYLVPQRVGTGVLPYGAGPVSDLTSIDVAPDLVYPQSPVEAQAGFGYVFAMDGGDGFARFGALRVTHVGRELIIFDWSFQTDPGNPQLLRAGG